MQNALPPSLASTVAPLPPTPSSPLRSAFCWKQVEVTVCLFAGMRRIDLICIIVPPIMVKSITFILMAVAEKAAVYSCKVCKFEATKCFCRVRCYAGRLPDDLHRNQASCLLGDSVESGQLGPPDPPPQACACSFPCTQVSPPPPFPNGRHVLLCTCNRAVLCILYFGNKRKCRML